MTNKWELNPDKFKCPYCDYEYERIVDGATIFKYKEKYYNNEFCVSCGKEFLHSLSECVKMPENTDELGYRGYWIS